MPLQATSGTASYDAFGGGVAAVPTYIEDVFSTWLYQGTSANQTITNGIDLSTKGGLVWCKGRPNAGYSHRLFDTARGVNNSLATNLTDAQATQANSVTAFNTTGFSLGSDANGEVNFSGSTYVGWTFRKQPKFFDVVTWTGNGASNRLITHALGAIPAVIMIKATSTTGSWYVSIRDNGLNGDTTDFANAGLGLESTSAKDSSFLGTSQAIPWTSTQFTLYATGARTNVNGVTYVAYLFAHNAGGFGLTGTDNVISCGSFTTDASGYADVNLGYEPQWILMKASSAAGAGENWITVDNMRGLVGTGTDYKAARLYPNLSNAEASVNTCQISSTGFKAFQSTSVTYIYVAIRRGPMKVPTSGTSVYNAIARTGTGAAATVTAGFPVDMVAVHMRNSTNNEYVADRLRGGGLSLEFCTTAVESNRSAGGITSMASNTGFSVGTYSDVNSSPNEYINWCFRRAPSCFDAVCYIGTGAAVDVNHNLKVKPELMLIKKRSSTGNWMFHHYKDNTAYRLLRLNETTASLGDFTGSDTNSTSFRAYLYTPDTGVANDNLSVSGATYVAYLFATCAGVSKVGSYTGNGSSQTINCGFTGGARFVLIKRTDSTGDWYVWDTARGIVSAEDPHLSLNTNAAEVTTDDSIDTDNTGFIVNQLAATNINVTSATYIFLAIA